jgi:hypothetical protein
VSPPISDEVNRLVRSLFGERSLFDRVRRRDHRSAILKQIADSREVRTVPDLFPLLAAEDSVAPHVASAIAELVRDPTPVELSWLDERLRPGSYAYYPCPWRKLAPEAVSRLAQSANLDPAVVGLVASHPNGFVRAAALEVLAQHTEGQEIPFLALRANDWVEPVANRASELLLNRLRPDNRNAVLNGTHQLAVVPRAVTSRPWLGACRDSSLQQSKVASEPSPLASSIDGLKASIAIRLSQPRRSCSGLALCWTR